jgi:hypothetical protein
MLYSPSMDIGFAHYPKTAGHSLTNWFREAFPDAYLVEPHPIYQVNHLPVRESLERLGLVERRLDRLGKPKRGLSRFCARLTRHLAGWMPVGRTPRAVDGAACGTRIIGVVREPFDMLVSLFEYWRCYDFKQAPIQPLIVSARSGTFREFLRRAVVDRELVNYQDFFDVHGPARSTTRLLDFHSLEPALAHVCREFGVDMPRSKLQLLNAGPQRQRDLSRYRLEAGPLLSAVRSHFRWYYEEGMHVMVKGAAAPAASRHSVQRHRLYPSLPASPSLALAGGHS